MVGRKALPTLQKRICSIVPLFLRKLVLGIQAQASGKNDAATHAFGGPSRPATLATSLYHAR